MEKPAETQYPVQEIIRKRWSPRAFAEKPVPVGVLHSLLEAARWSASSFNEQPWRYLIATQESPAEFQKMLSCLVEKNQQWAKGAPVLMISFFKKVFSHNKTPNRMALHDVGAASAQLALEAAAHGLFIHQMGGIELDKIKSTYQIPEEFEPAAAIALGYPGPIEKLNPMFQEAEKAPRQRKTLKEIVFAGAWDKSAL